MIGVFLDTETNGLNVKIHKILEIALKIVDLLSGEIKESRQAILSIAKDDWEKSDPESLKINHFTWEETIRGQPASQVSQELIDCFAKWGIERKKAVFICQNPSFDRAFFSQLVDPETQERLLLPYHWLDLASMHWAIAMKQAMIKKSPFPWDTGLSKDLIAKAYGLQPEEKPHRAMNGVNHLLLCYEAVIGSYPKAKKGLGI